MVGTHTDWENLKVKGIGHLKTNMCTLQERAKYDKRAKYVNRAELENLAKPETGEAALAAPTSLWRSVMKRSSAVLPSVQTRIPLSLQVAYGGGGVIEIRWLA